MLNKFEVSVSREEVEGVDTLRYSFEKLLAQAVSDKTSNTGFKCVHPQQNNTWLFFDYDE